MKLAIVSHVLPSAASGQAIVLSRLLEGLPPESYCLISNLPGVGGSQCAGSCMAPHTYHVELPPPQFTHGSRFGLPRVRRVINRYIALYYDTVLRGRQIAAILRREGCDTVVACTGDLGNLPAGCLASRHEGARFLAYIFDDYVYQWIDPWKRTMARRMEPGILRHAAGVIVPNEFMRDEVRRRCDVEPTVIHNPVEVLRYRELAAGEVVAPDGDAAVVYTGAVYQAQGDAMTNMVEAIKLVRHPGVRLHLYTEQPDAALNRLGLVGPVIWHAHVASEDIPAIHQRADVLFLPLAFRSAYPEVIRTSAPGKLGEYLAAGRPILVHAPPDSFVAWYFREHACGLVVDRPDPAMLASALESLLRDPDLCAAMTHRARVRAETDFAIDVARRRLASLLAV